VTVIRKYHPALVTLHWLLAFLIIAALFLGAVIMVRISNSNPMKMEALRNHGIAGVLILVLTLARLTVRERTDRPPDATTHNPWLDRLAWWSHRLLYVAVLGMALSGAFMAYQANLVPILFEHEGRLPASFWVYPVRSVHYAFSRLLMGLIALHVAGALYHTFVLRDRLLRRMSFGDRTAVSPPGGLSTEMGR
jgi:cytochrome b561